MPESIRQLERKGEIVAEVAALQPRTREAALGAYAEIREREISRALWDLEATSEWRARDIGYQCAALAEIRRSLAPETEAEKKKPARGGRKPADVVPIAARSPLQMQLDLAAMLESDRVGEVYMPVLDALKDAALTAVKLGKDVRVNQAMGCEVDELVRFLRRVEEAANRARVAVAEEARRGGIPRDPRQAGGVRMSM